MQINVFLSLNYCTSQEKSVTKLFEYIFSICPPDYQVHQCNQWKWLVTLEILMMMWPHDPDHAQTFSLGAPKATVVNCCKTASRVFKNYFQKWYKYFCWSRSTSACRLHFWMALILNYVAKLRITAWKFLKRQIWRICTTKGNWDSRVTSPVIHIILPFHNLVPTLPTTQLSHGVSLLVSTESRSVM